MGMCVIMKLVDFWVLVEIWYYVKFSFERSKVLGRVGVSDKNSLRV